MNMPDVAQPKTLDFIPDNNTDLRSAVVNMAAGINLADWKFIKLIVAMYRSRAWSEAGYCSLSNWLDHRCGLGPVASRERVRIGLALTRLPCLDQAFQNGEISYSKVRTVTRIANPETERFLLALARTSSAFELERVVRTYERSGGAAAPTDAALYQARSLTWHYENGMVMIQATLPADQGAMVVKALQQVVNRKAGEREAYWEERYASTF